MLVASQEIWLPDELFAGLCRLAAARLEGGSGVCRLKSLTAFRLRKAFNEACGQPVGPRWIESIGPRYRLSLGPERLVVRCEACAAAALLKVPGRAVAVLEGHVLKSLEIE